MDVTRLLITHGADVAAQSQDGTTPLHLASLWDDLDVARFLIEHGADAAAQRKDGMTPLRLASQEGPVHPGLARLHIEHGGDAAAPSKDTVWDVLRRTYGFGLARHRAQRRRGNPEPGRDDSAASDILTGDVDVARPLIEHGGDAAASRKDGTAPPRLAFRRRVGLGLARLLRRHGSADATAQSRDT